MKPIFIYLVLLLFPAAAGDSFYNLTFTGIGSVPISCLGFQGKRVVVVAFNGAQPDWGMLRSLDSLQKQQPASLAVLAFPAMDLDSGFSAANLAHVHDSLGLTLSLGLPGYVKKSAAVSQLPVFQWLTNMSRNTHFNRDVEADGQMFVISPKGTLYSVIEKTSYSWLLPNVLSATVQGE